LPRFINKEELLLPVSRFSTGKRLVFILSMLVLVGLACSLGGQDEALGPPGGSISVNQEAADRLKQNFNQALQEATGSREASLRITNEEITSLVAQELTETGQIPMSNPQVWFTSGRIYITGQMNSVGPVEVDSLIVATAVVEAGRMVVKVEEAQMGPLAFPDTLIESMTQTVNETLAGLQVDADLEITRIEILEGEMFVIGHRRTP
jgi:hypothetical protein